MKQLYLLFTLFLFTGFGQLTGQAGTTIQLKYDDFMGRPISHELLFSATSMNSTNEYKDADAGVYVFWNSSTGKWAINDLNNNENLFESSAMTGTNPPNLSSSTWVSVKSGYILTTFSGTGTVAVAAPLSVEISALSDAGCNGAANGSMTAEVTGGVSPYTYTWSNGETTVATTESLNTIVDLIAGTYSVIVTDDAGTKVSTSATVTQPTVLSARISGLTNVACFGGNSGSAKASGSGGTPSYSYLWSNGAKTATASNLSAGTYTVTVTDSHGCSGVTSATVTEPPLLVASSQVESNVTCFGGSDGETSAAATGGTPPYRYDWSNGATTAVATGVSAGTYSVTVTDGKGCTSTASSTVTEPPALVVAQVSQTNIACNGSSTGAATVTATGGAAPYTYAWSNNAATTAEVTGISAGTYVVTVTDANGCSGTASFTITEPTALSATAVVDGNVSCNGGVDGAVTASGTGGTPPYTYLWSNSATTAEMIGLAAGTYTVTITDANGCTDMASATVTEPTVLQVSPASQTDIACNGSATGEATVSATGGTAPYTYVWSNTATTASIAGVTAGNYTVTVTDANGCSDATEFTITEPTALMASGQVDANVGCNGGTDGIASALVTGGTAPYVYLWSNGATAASATDLAAGTYTVTITDANGCTAEASSTVTEPAVLSANLFSQTNLVCNGAATGAATVNVAGGMAPYTYVWSNGATTATATGLVAGEYTVTVTDANGCADFTSATLTEPEALIATGSVTANAGCFGSSEGAATVTVTGGLAPYTYAWSNGATTSGLAGLTAGTYELTATDDNGCTATTTVTITQAPEITLITSSTEDSGAGDGMATVSAMGGIAPYTYLWDTAEAPTTDTLKGLVAGEYTVTVTDADGCTVTSTVTVSPRILPGEVCAKAIAIDSLLGGATDLAVNSGMIDNSEYASDTVFMDGQPLCFAEGDTLYHPMYFQFTGDGETYRIRTTGEVDTRGAVFSGSCGDFTRLACNEDEADDTANMMVELSTEAGVTYTLLVDGSSFTGGEYALEVTQITTTAVTPVRHTAIAVYPNPTSGRVSITGVDAQQVDVFDGFGRRVSTYVQPGTEVDLQQLPAGVYYLRITDERQAVYSARLVRQ